MTAFIIRIIGILLEADYPCRPATVTVTSARLLSDEQGNEFCLVALAKLLFIRWFRSLGKSLICEKTVSAS